jgi:hypothetical protein
MVKEVVEEETSWDFSSPPRGREVNMHGIYIYRSGQKDSLQLFHNNLSFMPHSLSPHLEELRSVGRDHVL